MLLGLEIDLLASVKVRELSQGERENRRLAPIVIRADSWSPATA